METEQEKKQAVVKATPKTDNMKSTRKDSWLFEPTSVYTILLAIIMCGFIIFENYYPDFITYLSAHGIRSVEKIKFFPETSMGFVLNFIEWFGVLYGFLMPLILVRAWEQFDSIDREFDREADTIKIIYEDISLLQNKNTGFKIKIFKTLLDYINHVIKHHVAEAKSNSVEREQGDKYLKEIRRTYYDLFHLSTAKKKETDTLSAEMLRQLNKLIDVRGDRISSSNQRLFESLRFVSLITSVVFIVPFYFVKFYHQEYGFLDSFLVIGVIFLVVFILTTIEDLDEPFTGSWKISVEPWRRIRKEILSSLAELDGT